MLEMAKNYYLMLSRMEKGQVYYRLIRLLKKRIWYKLFRNLKQPKVAIKYDLNCGLIRNLEDNIYDFENDYKKKVIFIANKVISRNFSFLNSSYIDLGNPIDWNYKPDGDQLWNYYLHYFDFLNELREAYFYTKNTMYFKEIIKIIEDWIDNTNRGTGAAWDSYPISRRLQNWSYIWWIIQDKKSVSERFKQKFLHSIGMQTEHLYRNLELDLKNNHYTANGKALFWIGLSFPYLDNSKKWLKKGEEILLRQLKREIKPDGSQYENSTSYQLVTAMDYLEVLLLSKKMNYTLPTSFYIVTEKMFDWLLKITKPDNTLPLLNDSVKGYPIELAEIMAVASVYFKRGDYKYISQTANFSYLLRLLGTDCFETYKKLKVRKPKVLSEALKDSGYYVYRNGWDNDSTYLIFDAGPIGPEHCCGHAHADNLSFELYTKGTSVFIDPGTYEYGNSHKRNKYRSTKSHNTIEIENRNQSTFWGAFRVGHIAYTEILKSNLSQKNFFVSANHNGYKRLKQRVIHERSIVKIDDNVWEVIDKLSGRGEITGKCNFQLNDSCMNVLLQNNKKCILYFSKKLIVDMTFVSKINFEIDVIDDFISKEWKTEYKSKKIQVSFNKVNLPFEIRTQIKLH